ncbi:unnamed protein product [Orchesella dallaii]|uniref:Fibronectin type-III domain-containing protein n=1 Tax=Orchesella dallaii TaxID=48710 RepID=A0ABP1Q017_9HEXA
MAIGEIFQERLSTFSPFISSTTNTNSFESSQSVSSSEGEDGLETCPPASGIRHISGLTEWRIWRIEDSRPESIISSSTTNENSSLVHQERENYHPHHYQHYRHKLNSLSLHLILVLVLTTLFLSFFPSPVGSASAGQDDNEDLVCAKGLTHGWPGATFPRGDIILKEGDTLEVYCKLNLTDPSAEGYNASFIDFRFHKADVRAEQVVTKVINETTAVVRVKNMNASSIFLRCDLKRPNGSRIQVCQNSIDVGFPPLPVDDFRCIANEWQSLNCTWRLPSNPVRTRYTLTKVWKRFNIPCPNTTATSTSCSWGSRTEPTYRQNTDPLHFRLNGTNALVPSGITWDYSFSLGSIVIPERPTLILTKKSAVDYKLNWTFPNYEYFKPGLDHQLTICCEFEPLCKVTKFRTKPVDGKMTPFYVTDISLPLAYANYTIKVRLRSPDANNTEEFWSVPAIHSIRTEAKAPEFPPETDIGSYENEMQKHNFRDIYIYWKSIPERYKNGSNFQYQIDVFERTENERELTKLSSKPQVINESYAKFAQLSTHKSYVFRVFAENSRGRSLNTSEISVPSVDSLPEGPKSVSKLDFTNGSFEISWKKPDQYHGIVSYTVFSCSSKMPRPYQCEGPLKWDRVDANPSQSIRKFYNSLPNDSDRIYQFAVSSNTENFSSGMIWATYCTLIHNKVPGKLRTVRYEDPKEDEILIKWDLECSYQSGDIEGFKITYCQVEQYPADRCKDDVPSSAAVEGADKTAYRLVKLKPYSYYKIDVSIIAAAGESKRSDPIYARTSEGAPSHAQVSRVSHVTNTSATLLIESPDHLNGIVREYKIYYGSKADKSEQELRFPQVSNDTISFPKEITLNNLRSNTRYNVQIVACTLKCSSRSDPFTFVTDIGHTDMTSFPEISMDGSDMLLEWKQPERLGGPISYFQLLLKQNGKQIADENDYTVEYRNGSSKFDVRIPQSCEQGTNFTAQVRAVTKLSSGQLLNGAWSPPGNYSCGGGVSWLIWIMLVFVVFAGILFSAYLSVRCYHYFRHMKEVPIKLPPGLNSELNGFTHKPPPRSRSSDQSYGKEPFSYPLQPTSRQLDESKDFLSSSELNQGEAEESLIEKPFCPSPSNPLLDFSNTSNGGSMEDEEHDIGLAEFNNIHQDRCSSPAYKKLGALANGGCVVSMEPTPGPSTRTSPSISAPSVPPTQRSSQPQPPSSLKIEPSSPLTCNGINGSVPDVLGSSPSSPTSQNPISSSSSLNAPSPPPPAAPPVAPAPAQNSSYVKWTTLVPDMRTGDAGGIIENGNRQSPYCQVGILLDS